MNLNEFIQAALAEDVGSGDHTSMACINTNVESSAKLLIKEDGIIAGIEIAREIFKQVDDNLVFKQIINDGQQVKKGDIAFYVSGSPISILTAERVVLNIMQRMSGIATQTNLLVNELKGLQTKILDTRKTTPLLRFIEKQAVKIGGGYNHRFGLYDMILIKDNHIDFSGGIKKAIENTQAYLLNNNLNLKIEIETRNIDEVMQVLNIGGVHRIMLDNYDIDTLAKAVKLIGGKYETEASGGITLNNIRQYAETGVNYISVGSITHSVKCLDLSLKAC
jgi:nicotinate-nucleotide pyrophosphorylase (carboxylating)